MAKKKNDPGANPKPPQPKKPVEPDLVEDVVEEVIEDIELVEGSSKKMPRPDEPLADEDVLEDIEIVEGSSKKMPRPDEPLAVEDVVEDVIEDMEVVEGSSRKMPKSGEPMAVEDVLEDIEIVEGSSKKMPKVEEPRAVEAVEEDVLDVEVAEGSSKKLPLPVEDVLDVDVLEGSSKKLPPLEEDVLDVEVAEGSSQKLPAADADVMEEVEVLEGSSKKLPLPVEDVMEEVEVLEGSSKKLPPAVEDVMEEVEVLEGSSKKLPAVEDVMEDVEVVEGSSKKLPLSMVAEEVEEEILDVAEAAEGSSKKLPAATAEVVEDVAVAEEASPEPVEVTDEADVVEEKQPRGPLMPPKPPSGKMPLEPQTKPKAGTKPTAIGPKKAAATRIGNKAATPTMLAGSQEPDELPDTGLGGLGGLEAPSAEEEEEILDVTEAAPGTALKGPPENVDVMDEEILVEGASEVDLGKKSGTGTFASGVDMIAEALESGVDLDSSKTKPSKRPRPSEIDLDGSGSGPDSSAVDLGSSANLPALSDSAAGDVVEVAETTSDSGKIWEGAEEVDDESVLLSGGVEEEGELLVAPSSKKQVEVIEEAAESSIIMEGEEDLVVPKAKTKAKPQAEVEEVDEVEVSSEADDEELILPKSKTKAKVGKSKVVVEEEDEDEVLVKPKPKTKAKTSKVAITVGADAEEEEPTPRNRGKEKETIVYKAPRRGFFAVLLGTLLWMLGFLAFVIVAAAVGIWYARPDLLQEVPVSPGDQGKNKMKWQAKPTPNLAQEAQDLSQQGKLDQALSKVENAKTPAELSARAEILLKMYLVEKGKNQELSKDDAQVKKALADANSANNLFLVRLIEDTLDNFKKLRDELTAANKKEQDLIALGKENDEKIKTINTQLDAAKIKEKDVVAVAMLLKEKAKLEEGGQGLAKQVKDLEKDKVELSTMVKTLEKDKDGLTTTVKSLEKDKVGLIAALDKAKLAAQSPIVSYMGNLASSLTGVGSSTSQLFKERLDTTRLQAELAMMRTKLALHETPEQRLDLWIALLQHRERHKGDLDTVSRYADWVASKEANAHPQTKAKALLAVALALRNHDKFAEAKKTLAEAQLAAERAEAKDVGILVQARLRELTDPAEYYLPKARHLFEGAKAEAAWKTLDGFDRFIMIAPDHPNNGFAGALAVVEEGLRAMPDNAQLLVARALVQLERPQVGKLPEGAIRQDAEAARKDNKVEPDALYVLGRLAERLGQLDKAEGYYSQALKHPALKDQPEEKKDRYRAALAKVLQLPRAVPLGAAEEKAAPNVEKTKLNADKTSRNTPAPTDENLQLVADPAMLVMLLVTCVQAPGDDEEDLAREQRILDSMKQAREMMNSKNTKTQGEGFMIMGKAYLLQNKRTEAIRLYARGLELYYPGQATADLIKMLVDHPAFQRPEEHVPVDPLVAQRYFAKGLEYFGVCEYARAEKEFQLATSYFEADARYHYFLGMARYQQNTKKKRELAGFDFQTGARLEAANRPDMVRINASLERVQGPLRLILSDYRQKAIAGN